LVIGGFGPLFSIHMSTDPIKRLYGDFREALEAYFNAANDSQGKSDSDAILDIFNTHMTLYLLSLERDSLCFDEPNAGYVDVDGEGLNLSYNMDSVFNRGLLEKFDPISRIELLESCIYALNKKLVELETEIRKRNDHFGNHNTSD
jgi:hypothetical protein